MKASRSISAFPARTMKYAARQMAANDMPDLFDTHGWAKIRYGEYTADLKTWIG
ncbi:hypothetical protein PO124_10375 [Bacillus licheniformis]|nr:hypothetical protein [Bacillus licheniformis]